MGEELDYMSDEFLTNCVDGVKDLRPGLLKSRSDQRQHNLLKKKLELENKNEPTEVLQVRVLEESLKKPINAANKGFSMLEKMGFKSGMGLGKNNAGIREPIEINIKKDKMGLGHKDLKKQEKLRSGKESKLENMNENDYRTFLSMKNKERETLSDFRKSQKICKELDLKVDISVPEESWFWPEEESSEIQETMDNDNNDNNEGLDLSVAVKLEILTRYLREHHFYCIWCSVQFNDKKDLEDCPGAARDDH